MELDTALLNTQHYKVCIKGKVKQPRERSSAYPTPLCSSYCKKEPSGRPQLRLPTLLTNVNKKRNSNKSSSLHKNVLNSFIEELV